ncbi:MAG: cytochrome c biogenesis protein ResB [Dehalococcoidia bacterium]
MTGIQQALSLGKGLRGLDPLLSVWRVLTSVYFALGLIGFLALAGLLGTLLPQIPGSLRGNPAAVDAWLEEQRGKFGVLTDVMHDLELFSIFSAPWFIAALGLLAVAVGLCAANRLSRAWRAVSRPLERVPDTYFEQAANRYSLPTPTDERALESALRRQRFKVKRFREGATTYLFADRFAWARFGTFVSHLSLILLLAGALVSRLGGFEASLFVAEGTTAPVFAADHPNQTQVLVEDAVAHFDEAGSPLDYRTHLVIYQGGREVARGTTTVNRPFSYEGYRFHQASYFGRGAALRVRDTATGDAIYSEVLVLDETTPAPVIAVRGAGGETLLRDVIPPTDFVGTASGTLLRVPGPDTRLWVGVKPAPQEERWQLVVYEPGEPENGVRLLLDEGERATAGGLEFLFMGVTGLPSSLETGIPGTADRALVEISSDAQGTPYLTVLGATGDRALILYPDAPVEVDGREYTFLGPREFAGIQVRKDPGTNFVWVGAGLLLVGLVITFYLPRRRLWLRITRARTDIAAPAERSGGFKSDMRKLAERLDPEGKAAREREEE